MIVKYGRFVIELLFILAVLQLTACASSDKLEQGEKPLADTWRQANDAYAEKEWNKAQVLYEVITEKFPDDSEAHFRMGVSAYRQGNRKLAEESFSKVVRLEPGSTKAAFNLAIVQLNDAYDLLMQCVRNAANDAERIKYSQMAQRIAELQRPQR
jgi:outer membrane protein assembly factor BamD (BamD/ComL family)